MLSTRLDFQILETAWLRKAKLKIEARKLYIFFFKLPSPLVMKTQGVSGSIRITKRNINNEWEDQIVMSRTAFKFFSDWLENLEAEGRYTSENFEKKNC